jgi:hypothetical protein
MIGDKTKKTDTEETEAEAKAKDGQKFSCNGG